MITPGGLVVLILFVAGPPVLAIGIFVVALLLALSVKPTQIGQDQKEKEARRIFAVGAYFAGAILIVWLGLVLLIVFTQLNHSGPGRPPY